MKYPELTCLETPQCAALMNLIQDPSSPCGKSVPEDRYLSCLFKTYFTEATDAFVSAHVAAMLRGSSHRMKRRRCKRVNSSRKRMKNMKVCVRVCFASGAPAGVWCLGLEGPVSVAVHVGTLPRWSSCQRALSDDGKLESVAAIFAGLGS